MQKVGLIVANLLHEYWLRGHWRAHCMQMVGRIKTNLLQRDIAPAGIWKRGKHLYAGGIRVWYDSAHHSTTHTHTFRHYDVNRYQPYFTRYINGDKQAIEEYYQLYWDSFH